MAIFNSKLLNYQRVSSWNICPSSKSRNWFIYSPKVWMGLRVSPIETSHHGDGIGWGHIRVPSLLCPMLPFSRLMCQCVLVIIGLYPLASASDRHIHGIVKACQSMVCFAEWDGSQCSLMFIGLSIHLRRYLENSMHVGMTPAPIRPLGSSWLWRSNHNFVLLKPHENPMFYVPLWLIKVIQIH